MNKVTGQGNCIKCGKPAHTFDAYVCSECNLRIKNYMSDAFNDLLFGPPMFRGFQEFIIPQYEKDQDFSEAFGIALKNFLHEGKKCIFRFPSGAVTEVVDVSCSWWINKHCGYVFVQSGIKEVVAIELNEVDRIILCPDFFSYTPEAIDETMDANTLIPILKELFKHIEPVQLQMQLSLVVALYLTGNFNIKKKI